MGNVLLPSELSANAVVVHRAGERDRAQWNECFPSAAIWQGGKKKEIRKRYAVLLVGVTQGVAVPFSPQLPFLYDGCQIIANVVLSAASVDVLDQIAQTTAANG